jgi:hypothetical protein
MRGLFYALVPLALGGAALFECSSDHPCDDAGACVDASTIPTVSGGGCDSSKPAAQGGCAVDDSDGFFVSPTGSDSAVGSKVAPFKTIAKGISAAATATKKPNVYVCAGTYPENLVIQNAPEGVALHGGFDCASWAQTNAVTTVAPAWTPNASAPQYVLHVLGAAALVEGMVLTAPDATDPGASSIVVLVDGSSGTTFRRATATAGKASDGVTATPLQPTAPAANGNPGGYETLASSKSCPCGTDTSVGGQGGGTDGGAGLQYAEAGLPVVNGDNTKGQPGVGYGTNGACNGGDGANGLVGTTGGNANSVGTLTANGWASKAGTAGGSGGTGQGGGGGAWPLPGQTACGGGGACGGCGGQGGVGGTGGGASIAVAALNTTLRIQSSTIRGGNGGNGGNGSIGQAGQPGGTGGTGACTGGNGGAGGGGGGGGGGAGGVSIAIATVNTTPDIDTQSTVLAGTAGQGGHDGSAAQTKAIDGIAEAVHPF